MFFRVKKSGPRQYLQIVENRWEQGGSKQRVVATLGRMDELRAERDSGILASQGLEVLRGHDGHFQSKAWGTLAVSSRRIGPGLVFERLWQETGCREVIEKLLSRRRFDFAVGESHFSYGSASAF